jgi:hypothetical protein
MLPVRRKLLRRRRESCEARTIYYAIAVDKTISLTLAPLNLISIDRIYLNRWVETALLNLIGMVNKSPVAL